MVRVKHLWSWIIICCWIVSSTLYPHFSIVSGQVDQATVESLPTETQTITPDLPLPIQDIVTATASVTPSPTGITEFPSVTETPLDSEVTIEFTRLLVRTTGLYSPERLMAKGAERILDMAAVELAKIGVMIMDVPTDQVAQIKKELKADPDVIFVESDGEVQALDVFPNDTNFGSQ